MTDAENKKPKPRFNSWREWAVLSNLEKPELYPTLTAKEKSIIWCDEYMKIIPLNVKPLTEFKGVTDNEFTK